MRYPIITLFSFLCLLGYSQAPSGYYDAAVGKNKAALKTALSSIVETHTERTYADLWTDFIKTDSRPDGKVSDIYSSTTNYSFGSGQCGSYNSEGDCFNREHSFPKSWFSDATPMYTDLFHLYPSDGYVNNMRSNYPFGEVSSPTYTSANGYSKLGPCSYPGYTGTVFEPVDSLKGDFARTYFYMVTAYDDKVANWSSDQLAGNQYPALSAWSVAMFLKWNANDPVGAKEINRNNAVYGIQGNRNPFIDHPELAEYIWGTHMSDLWGDTSSPYLSAPSSGSTVDFGKVIYLQSASSTLKVAGANITGNLSFALSGANANAFSISTTSISSTQANAGYDLTVGFQANATGAQTATLTISGGGITTTTITLKASAADEFAAVAATNVSSNGFTANWTTSAGATGYNLNVFTLSGVNSKQTLIDDEFTSLSAWTTSGYASATDLSGYVKLASSSKTGAITSAAKDLSGTSTLTINAKQYNSDNSKLHVLIDADTISHLTMASTIGEFVVNIPAKTSTSTLTLAASKGGRLYIDNVKLVSVVSTETSSSLAGYPKTLGVVLADDVAGLTPSTTYYYTVTPQGNSATISNRIQVNTSLLSGVSETSESSPVCVSSAGGILVRNVSGGKTVRVYNMLGMKISELMGTGNDMAVALPVHGIYLVVVGGKQDALIKVKY